MKIIITGGHLSPALEVIDALISKPGWSNKNSILMIGKKYAFEADKTISLEYKTMVDKKIPFKNITTGRLQRKFTKYTFFSLIKFPYGFLQAFFILLSFKPSVVLSFGGYVGLPVALASYILGIPVVIHEQTLEAGMVNKIVALFAKKICVSWESSRRFFPQLKVVYTGNPVRKYQISRLAAKRANIKYQISKDKIPLIYITGGSSGSHAINVLIEGCIEKLLRNYRVIHQTGESTYNDFARLENLKKNLPEKLQARYCLTKFINPYAVGSILNKADLVCSRSGINTVVELIYFGKPALLIPLPYSQNNEQLKNAWFLQKVGLGEVLNQDSTTSEQLYKKIAIMLDNVLSYRSKAENAKKLIVPNAAENIINVLSLEIN